MLALEGIENTGGEVCTNVIIGIIKVASYLPVRIIHTL